MQSTGHAWVLQSCVSSACGHTVPPFVAAVLGRLRSCEPVPHDLVHVDQAPQDAITQFKAQLCVLHARDSSVCGHALPPFFGSTWLRLRCCEPVPHDAVHVDQASQIVLTTQSSAHAAVLHARVSSRYGHT